MASSERDLGQENLGQDDIGVGLDVNFVVPHGFISGEGVFMSSESEGRSGRERLLFMRKVRRRKSVA